MSEGSQSSEFKLALAALALVAVNALAALGNGGEVPLPWHVFGETVMPIVLGYGGVRQFAKLAQPKGKMNDTVSKPARVDPPALQRGGVYDS